MTDLKQAIILVSLLILAIAVPACVRVDAFPPTLEPATDASPSSTLQPTSTLVASMTVQATVKAEQTMSAPQGLQIVYLQEGNLWSWTETGGSAMLTGTGDMSTVRLSEDGQLLAFIRGLEVWTIRMDGTDLLLLVTLEEEGGALSFSPDGSLLAISTTDHIDVVDLVNETVTTVFSYPVTPDGYNPEVVWSPDGAGFKTIIPPTAEKGQAEFLFVFPNGIVASLGKFPLIPLSESLPFISPDGGYVLYVAGLKDGQESLHLMDSSGATKPYGQPAKSIRAYGWLPDSKSFSYVQENTEQVFLGNVVGNQPVEIDFIDFEIIRWVDAGHFLVLQGNSLYLGDMDGGKTLIANDVSDFDFGQ